MILLRAFFSRPHLSSQHREKLQARKALALQKQLEDKHNPSMGSRTGPTPGGFVTVEKTAREQPACGNNPPYLSAAAPGGASHLSALTVAANPAMLAALHAAKARAMGLPAQAAVQSTVRGVWAPSNEGVRPASPCMPPPYKPLGR